jgi:hypothetical protein
LLGLVKGCFRKFAEFGYEVLDRDELCGDRHENAPGRV